MKRRVPHKVKKKPAAKSWQKILKSGLIVMAALVLLLAIAERIYHAYRHFIKN